MTSIARLPDCEDVWDITVPGVEHFALANGAIVHNSADSFRYAAVVARQTGLLAKAGQVKKTIYGPAFPTGIHLGWTWDQLVAATPPVSRRI